ncbi:MAG: hypothetical protein L3J47_06715 [Sulfurovum sp.]|nr:hypothetical protein [Sulfurovum sp.]
MQRITEPDLAAEILKTASQIVISADITNEEAYVLQEIQKKYGTKLYSPIASNMQRFMDAYAEISGKSFPIGDWKNAEKADLFILFGLRYSCMETEAKNRVERILELLPGRAVYLHPMEDSILKEKIEHFIKYEVGSEAGVTALLLYALLNVKECDADTRKSIEALDIGYLSAECNVGEEELEAVVEGLDANKNITLIIGEDIILHPEVEMIAVMMALLEKHRGVTLLLESSLRNALGVATLCKLETKSLDTDTLLYAPYSSIEDDGMHAKLKYSYKYVLDFAPKEGSVVAMDGRLQKVKHMRGDNQALMSLVQQLDLPLQVNDPLFLQWSKKLKFDTEDRLIPTKTEADSVAFEVEEVPVFDGALLYHCHHTEEAKEFHGSEQFARVTKLKDGEKIVFEANGLIFKRVFKIDTSLKGMIAINPLDNRILSVDSLFSNRFSSFTFETETNQL